MHVTQKLALGLGRARQNQNARITMGQYNKSLDPNKHTNPQQA